MTLREIAKEIERIGKKNPGLLDKECFCCCDGRPDLLHRIYGLDPDDGDFILSWPHTKEEWEERNQEDEA